MLQWKTHTPAGALDILENECFAKRQVEQIIHQTFSGCGYFEIQTPSFEFYDVFQGEGSGTPQQDMIKFFDREGRILVLRPDLTTPVARLMATKLKDSPLPKRLSYIGSAFREGDAHAGAIQKEFTQAGLELIGHSSAQADAEVVAVTIKALLAVGLTDFQLDLGQAALYQSIMSQTGLPKEELDRMQTLIDRKSFVGIGELVKGYNIDQRLQQLILSLPNLFGGIDVMERIDRTVLCPQALAELDHLTEVYNILVDYGYEQYVAIDLGMVQGLDYYTGIIVKGYTRGVGFPICGGGRYDKLIGEFGNPLPATGIAIGLERVLSALQHSGIQWEQPEVHSLICFDTARKTAYYVAEGLRSSGLCVELWLGGDGAEDYAKSRNIGGMVRVLDDDRLEIVNLHTGEHTHTNLSDLLGGMAE